MPATGALASSHTTASGLSSQIRCSPVLVTVSRLGMALRRLRDSAEMTLEQASEAAGVSAPYVSRIERAQVAATVKVIKVLLGADGADEQISAELLEIAGEAGRRGWWHRYRRDNLIPPEYAALIQFEATASLVAMTHRSSPS